MTVNDEHLQCWRVRERGTRQTAGRGIEGAYPKATHSNLLNSEKVEQRPALPNWRDVAKLVNVRHADLLEKIGGYIKHLTNGKFRSLDFFIPSTYQDDPDLDRPPLPDRSSTSCIFRKSLPGSPHF
mgnify:CR=1 FL=1